MDSAVVVLVQALLRAFHVIFGIVWIGFLFFFVLVQRDAIGAMREGRREAIAQFAPRALYWFRWAALWTFVTGVLLLGMVYHMGGLLYDDADGNGLVTFLVFFTALLMAGAWDQIAHRFSMAASSISGIVFLMVLIVLMDRVADFGGRSLFIHIGGVLGLVLVMNVWQRVWPAWRKVLLPAIVAGTDPHPAVLEKVDRRSVQSVYIAVPTVLLMISNHYPSLYGSEQREAVLMSVIVAGFAIAWLLTRKRSLGVEASE